jgi:hypothetical protein
VTHTAFNFLGKDGDFYVNLSKIFPMDNLGTPNFFIEVSFNGMEPVNLLNEDFEVELGFITDYEKFYLT